ncbi:hypothetical protein P7C70_g5037, partial [Phenoliferia sp. Uapishka_3]
MAAPASQHDTPGPRPSHSDPQNPYVAQTTRFVPYRRRSAPQATFPYHSSPQHSSPPPFLPAEQYAAMYETLSRRWGEQAKDLAMNGKFARIVSKRPLESPEECACRNPSARVSREAPAVKRRRTDFDFVAGSTSPETKFRPWDFPQINSALHRRSSSTPTFHTLADIVTTHTPKLSPALPSFSTLSSSLLLDTETFDHETCSSLPHSQTSTRSSTPTPPDLPAYSPLLRTKSIDTTRSKLRAEALVNVVKSFEIVLGYRADGWRFFDDVVRGGARRSASLNHHRQ